MTFEKHDSKDSLAFRANVAEVECLADLTPGFLPLCECLNSTSEGPNKDASPDFCGRVYKFYMFSSLHLFLLFSLKLSVFGFALLRLSFDFF